MPSLQPREDTRPNIKTPQELVHIRHRITLLQYKYWVLMLRAYREVYEERGVELTDGEYCYLSMARLAEHLGYEPKTSEIERDLEAIRKEPIIFNVLEKDGKKGRTGRGFISEWYVSSNRIGVVLPPVIRRAVENLDNRESIFHLLNWSIFNSFTGKYEAVLYKLCKDYVGIGRTPYLTLEKFREYMGVKEGEYTDFKRLNQWVISGPVKRINESDLSDITIEPEFKREVRKIIGLWFSIKMKKQTVIDFGDDPAFRFSKVTIALAQQKEYLNAKGAEMVELSIQRANEYAEDLEKKGESVNFGALYRKAIEGEWGKEYASKKTRETEKRVARKKKQEEVAALQADDKRQEQVSDFNRYQMTQAVKSLTIEAKRQYGAQYRAIAGEGSMTTWNPEKADFTKPSERVKFSTWLRKQIAPPFDEVAFQAWLKSKQGVPAK